MGQTLASSSSTQVYSRSTGFTHYSDNVKDRKKLKLVMKRKKNADPKVLNNGNFTLRYDDDVADDFQNTKTSFVYTGTYFVEALEIGDEQRDGIGISTQRETPGDRDSVKRRSKNRSFVSLSSPTGLRSSDLSRASGLKKSQSQLSVLQSDMGPALPFSTGVPTGGGSSTPKNGGSSTPKNFADEMSDATSDGGVSAPGTVESSRSRNGAPQGKLVVTRFKVTAMRCTLSNDDVKSKWVVAHSTEPDCDADRETGNLVWAWPGASTPSADGESAARRPVGGPNVVAKGKEILHSVPYNELDFTGEEDPHTGSLHLHVRIPQLAAMWDDPSVVLLPMGGWDMERKK